MPIPENEAATEGKTRPAIKRPPSRQEEEGHTGIYLGPGVDLLEERDNVYYNRADGEIFARFPCNPTANYDTCDITRKEIQDGTWARLTGQGEGDLTDDPQFVSGWPDVDLR